MERRDLQGQTHCEPRFVMNTKGELHAIRFALPVLAATENKPLPLAVQSGDAAKNAARREGLRQFVELSKPTWVEAAFRCMRQALGWPLCPDTFKH